MPHPLELREQALTVLALGDPAEKVRRTHALWEQRDHCAIDNVIELAASQPLPGRPDRPTLVPPQQVPWRTAFSLKGRAALLHSIAHIEFNAINLALDAIWRFPTMPRQYYLDWLQVAHEEALHFSLLAEHLDSLGYAYGDFDAHSGLWDMAERTASDITARMGLVPRILEARGLDVTPALQAKFAQAGDPRAVEILAIILRDEIGHVATGNRWYQWCCARFGRDPIPYAEQLSLEHRAPRIRPPLNESARLAAGFTADEISRWNGHSAPEH